jgi:outer membrane protein OmpA-like peptidoglycan-associated protein
MQTNDFSGYTEIAKGESAQLRWDIANAEKVKITNLGAILEGKDSINVFPAMTTTYEFLAYNEEDTLDLTWRVKVLDGNNAGVGKGIDRIGIPADEISYLESDYLRGLNQKYDKQNIAKVKAMHKRITEDSTLVFKMIALDDFGNMLTDLPSDVSWMINKNCAGSNTEVEISSFKEDNYEKDNDNIEISLLVENSVIAGEQFPVVEYIETYLYALDKKDKIRIDFFNHNLEETISLREVERLRENPKMYDKPVANGLNAVYKAGYKTLKNFADDFSDNPKIMIIVAFSPDNSSIIYKANDIVDIARKNEIPVYTVGIGSAVESYVLKYIADATGGRNYYLPEDRLFDLPFVLSEISFAQKANYEVEFNLKTGSCDIADMAIGLNQDMTEKDEFKVYYKKEAQYSGYQAIAAFEDRDTVVTQDFFPNIRSLAQVLKDNPNAVIELIGNSSMEVNYVENQRISLDRAQSVRRLLIESGAAPKQIRVRGEGASQPLYYFQERVWQKYFNRRVEIRWLDPELLPFEIIADMVKSESLALDKVEAWENAGYKAYYQRYLINNLPAYRVKLWGYATEAEADKAAEALQEKYRISFVVQ